MSNGRSVAIGTDALNSHFKWERYSRCSSTCSVTSEWSTCTGNNKTCLVSHVKYAFLSITADFQFFFMDWEVTLECLMNAGLQRDMTFYLSEGLPLAQSKKPHW